MTNPNIDQKAPLLQVDEWVQGTPTNLDALLGQVILLEVFQVNCPGCFFYSLPQAVDLYRQYHKHGLEILGVATAFEDFELNTLQNLRKLLLQGEIVGATLAAFCAQGNVSGKLPFNIPFPVAMDQLIPQAQPPTEASINAYIAQYLPKYAQLPLVEQMRVQQRVSQFLREKLFSAATFESFRLQGTPSQVLIDKQGMLRASHFGHFSRLEWVVQNLLQE